MSTLYLVGSKVFISGHYWCILSTYVKRIESISYCLLIQHTGDGSEIPNNHLGMFFQPWKQWDIKAISIGDRPIFFQQNSSLTYCWWTKSCTSWGWWFIPLFDKGFIHPNGGWPWDFCKTPVFWRIIHHHPHHWRIAHLDRRLGGSVPFAVLLHQDLAETWWGVPLQRWKRRGSIQSKHGFHVNNFWCFT